MSPGLDNNHNSHQELFEPTNGTTSSANNVIMNNSAIESPFNSKPIIKEMPGCSITQSEPMIIGSSLTSQNSLTSSATSTNLVASPGSTQILSITDSSGTTQLTSSRKSISGTNLVTKLISMPALSPMDSLKEWSLNTFKCTKQLINEKRGICSITSDAKLQADIEQLNETRRNLIQLLRSGQQMNYHYTNLVKSQRQMLVCMNEMSMKSYISVNMNDCSTTSPSSKHNNHSNNNHPNNYTSNSNNHQKHSQLSSSKQSKSKQIVANFSSLSNNFSSTFTDNTSNNSDTNSNKNGISNIKSLDSDLCPIVEHIRQTNVNLSEDFKRNAMSINSTIKNGEKLISVLSFFCSNLSTLIYKTIEDTMETVRQLDFARLEYDAERNSMNSITAIQPTSAHQSSIIYSCDKLENARICYEQLKDDVKIKIKFLEENTIKVVHKQLQMFNNAFASYATGNTQALDATLRQYSIK